MSFYIKKVLFISGILLFPLLGSAIEPMDGYYSNDLLGAVDEAKERPHHYDYSNTYRYKRTTAQSIHLNPINLADLESTHLSMRNLNENREEDINQNLASEELSLDSNEIGSFDIVDQKVIIPNAVLPKNTGTSISLTGKLSSTGIINNSTILSTPRP